MKFEGIGSIKKLEFDIPNRTLAVIHLDDNITQEINELNLVSSIINSQKFDITVFCLRNRMLWDRP